MKKALLILICIGLMLPILAKGDDTDWIFDPPSKKANHTEYEDDLIKINFQKKDARLAMLYSAVVPGLGQFYADKSSYTTWVFPILEAGLIGGIVYFNSQGKSRTDKFEKYATGEDINLSFQYTVENVEYSLDYFGPRYNRSFQNQTQEVLKNYYPSDIYDEGFFRLDQTNTQHFYEDIGKYNKYVFGWADWYYRFAVDPRDGSFAFEDDAFDAAWIWAEPQQGHSYVWTFNIRIEDFLNGVTSNHIAPGTAFAAPMRQKYIQMRKDANTSYSYSRNFVMGLALNHVVSALNAYSMSTKINKTYLTQESPVQLKYYTAVKDGNIQPNLNLSWRF